MRPIIEQVKVFDWLMEGDPAIRWQTLRDILDKLVAQWRPEQSQVAKEAWGPAFAEPAVRWLSKYFLTFSGNLIDPLT